MCNFKLARQLKRSIAVFSAAAFFAASVPGQPAAGKTTAKQIQLTAPYTTKGKKASSTLTLKKGQSFKIKAAVFPAKAKKSTKLTYKSSKKKVASVNKKGKISAKKIGKTTVTIQAKKNKKIKAAIKVTVVKSLKKAKKISLNKSTLSFTLGSGKISDKLTAKVVSPKKATVKKFNWYSTDTAVAAVNKKGVVTAKKAGKANIIAVAADGRGAKASCLVSVYSKADQKPLLSASAGKGPKTSAVPTDPSSSASSANPAPSSAASLSPSSLPSPSSSAAPSSSGNPSSSAAPSPSGNPTSPASPSPSAAINTLSIVSGGRTGIKQGETLTLKTEGNYTGTVNWSVTDKTGVSISPAGVLTAASNAAAGGKITVTATAADNSVNASASFTIVENATPVLSEKQIQLNQDSETTPGGLTYRSPDAYSTVVDPERGEVIRFDASQGYTSSSYDVLAWMDVDQKYAGKTVTISAYLKYEKNEDIKKKMNLVINERWNYSNPAYKYNAEPDTWYHITGTYTFPAYSSSKYNGSVNRLYICRDTDLTKNSDGDYINAVYYIDDLMFYVDKPEVSGVTVKADNNATTVYQNHNLQFTSTVQGTGNPSQEVTYSLDPAVPGASIDDTGLLKVGNVAADTNITVKAASKEDPAVSGTAAVKVLAQTIDSVKVTAAKNATEIYQGNSLQLSANVTSTGEPDTSVTWSIDPSVQGVSISNKGLLTVENSVKDGTAIHVKATSVFDKTKSDQYTVTVRANKINSVTITAAGDKTTVSADLPLRLSAKVEVTGTPSEELTWSIQNQVTGASLASTTGSSNTLSVTSDVAKETEITVRAASNFDPSKYGEITITVQKDEGEAFDINKLNVEYFENFDASDATLDTIQESGVLSWKFTDPDANFSPNLNNSRSVKLRNNYGVHVAKPSLTFLQRQTYSFQGFFGSKEDYVQFKVENKEESEKTYNLSLMFRFIDIDADNSYIKEQMISDSSFVSYQLPLKLVAVDENEGETTVTNDIKIPFRCSQWTSGNMEYYDITGSVKIPAGKTVRLRLMLDGDLPQCLSPEHAAKGEGYDKMPHPCSFMIDNVAISTGEMNTITLKTGEDYQLNVDTLATDTVFYYTNCLAAQLTHSDYETDCKRFDVIPATVDDKGKITAKAPGDTVLIAEITGQDGSIKRKQCFVHVEE